MKRTLLMLSLAIGLAACDEVPVTPANTAVSGQSRTATSETDKNGDGWPDTAWDNAGPSIFDDTGSIGSNAGWNDVSQVPSILPESSSSSSSTGSSAATGSGSSRGSSTSSSAGSSDSSSLFDDSGNQNNTSD